MGDILLHSFNTLSFFYQDTIMRVLPIALIQLSQQIADPKGFRADRYEKLNERAGDGSRQAEAFAQIEQERKADSEAITILAWWARRNTWTQGPELGPFKQTEKLPEQCGGCYWTNDRDQEQTVDSIVMDNTRFITSPEENDGTYHRSRPDIQSRNLDQYWIFWPREAASKSVERGSVKMEGIYDRSFNLTTSYRRDSDIPRPFGSAEKALLDARYMLVNRTENGETALHYEEIQSGEENIAQIMGNKKEGPYATWLVSNCDETRGAQVRSQYVQRMIEAGLELDGFGGCFDRELIGSPWKTKAMENGKRTIKPGQLARYKFYLAFENSVHCTDYVSEKLWRNSLGQGLVPVVYGSHPADVKAMAPPNSYIHAEDFNSPAALAVYLDYLSKNDTAYLEYHQWRKAEPQSLDEYVPPSSDLVMKCGICQELKKRRANGNPRKMYKSVANWWWINQHDDECIGGQDVAPWVRQMETVTKDNAFDELKTKDNTTTETSTQVELSATKAPSKSRIYVWEPKQPVANTTVATEQVTNMSEKPHRGGIFKKENILKYGAPRPTTGPHRGGIYKTNKL